MEYLWALAGTGFAFLMTLSGSAIVYFTKNRSCISIRNLLIGMAAGVMLATSVWSLLIPAITRGREQWLDGMPGISAGFLCGFLVLRVLDRRIERIERLPIRKENGTKAEIGRKAKMLCFAMTLHNIPEGITVGLGFALAFEHGFEYALFVSAIVLAVGIGIQNFPEGAALSVSLKEDGLTKRQAFSYGTAAGIVEPIGGVLAVLVANQITPVMPFLLAYAAGTMIHVTVEELIPEVQKEQRLHTGTFGILLGFLVMMILDVCLG